MKEITLKSTGRKIKWQRCPRYVMWRHERTAQSLRVRVMRLGSIPDDASEEEKRRLEQEYGLSILEKMSDEEGEKFQTYVEDVVRHSEVGITEEQLEEMPDPELWEIFGLSTHSVPHAPVETKDGETDMQTVETFRDESVVSGRSEEVSDLRGQAV